MAIVRAAKGTCDTIRRSSDVSQIALSPCIDGFGLRASPLEQQGQYRAFEPPLRVGPHRPFAPLYLNFFLPRAP